MRQNTVASWGSRRVVAGLAILVVGMIPNVAATDDVRIEVRGDQGVIVSGRGESLRAILDELCQQSGVAFRYDDTDEPFAFTMDDVPRSLDVVLDSLLRGKSYVMRLGGARRVTSLHVLGAGDTIGPAPENRGYIVPPRLLDAAFTTRDPARRDAAIRQLVDTVRSDPQRLNNFLTADMDRLVRVLRHYPQAPAVLRTMLELPEVDASARSRLEALLAELN